MRCLDPALSRESALFEGQEEQVENYRGPYYVRKDRKGDPLDPKDPRCTCHSGKTCAWCLGLIKERS